MPTDSSTPFLGVDYLLPILRVGILLILFLYAIFALLIVRQVDLMSKTLITPVSPIVKAVSIVHAGLSVGFVILFFGALT